MGAVNKQFLVSLSSVDDNPPVFSEETIKNLIEGWGRYKVEVHVMETPPKGAENAGQGIFPKDKYWTEMKDKEKREIIDKYPEFYKALRSEAEKIGVDMDEMFYECRCGDEEEIEVSYYPYFEDRTLCACWSVSQNKIIEFSYEDNGNCLEE